jgi:hypothetical protein
MATLLWLVLGALAAVLAWLLPEAFILVPLVVLAVAIVAILLPREATAAGAKVAIGFGALYAVGFGRLLVSDPLAGSGATYAWFGGGMLIMVAGLVGVWRNRRRRQRRQAALKAAADLLAG